MPVAVHLEAWRGVWRCLVHGGRQHHDRNLRRTKTCVDLFGLVRAGVSGQSSAISTVRHRCAMVVHVPRHGRERFYHPVVM